MVYSHQDLEQGKLTAVVIFGKKEKNMNINVCKKLKFAKISRKDLSCTKIYKKAGTENLIIMALK